MTTMAVAYAPSSDTTALSNNNKNGNSNDRENILISDNRNTSATAIAIANDEEESLSADLASFLSNPAISKDLKSGSLDLASYSNTVERELNELETSCIAVYKEKAADIQFIQTELTECQNSLAALHEMLLGFQADLGGLSVEIRQLQDRSRKLDVQLKNRRGAEGYLKLFLQQIIISPSLTQALLNGPINMTFLKAVQELQFIYKSCQTSSTSLWSCDVDLQQTKAIKEMSVIVEQLRMIAVKRTREYFLQQMAALRRPQTNIRMIQVHGLLKYSALHDFLEDSSPTDACRREIYNVYVDSMKRTLANLFRSYQYQLVLYVDLTRTSASRIDVIAIEDGLLRDTITTKAKKRYDVFCLGTRMKDCFGIDVAAINSSIGGSNIPTSILSSSTETSGSDPSQQPPLHRRISSLHNRPQQEATKKMLQQQQQQAEESKDDNNNHARVGNSDMDQNMLLNDPLLYSLQQQTPIMAHLAIQENKKYPFECLFRSILGHLVDSVTAEHIFCRQFFKRDTFQALYGTTLSGILEQLENYLFNCYDAVCLLLMIKVTHCYKRIVKYRRIHSLDGFLDQVTQLLWPRLKTVMDNHIRSIQTANSTTLGTIDLHPHYISRRMGEFCCSVLLILHTTTANATTVSTTTGTNADGTPSNKNVMIRTELKGKQQQQHTRTSNSTSTSSNTSTTITTHRGNGKNIAPVVDTADTTPASRYASLVDESASSATEKKKTTSVGATGAATATTSSNTSSQSAGDKLLEDLSEMVESFILLLGRLSETHNTQKKRTVFLINNLDNIVCIFQERRVVYNSKELNRFAELLVRQREIFVEEELLSTAGFSKMIAFVQQTEAYIVATAGAMVAASSNQQQQQQQQQQQVHLDVNNSVVQSLVLDFASNWKQYIEQINKNVLSYFSNFRNGMEILKQCLTQLLLYYTRFQDILRKVYGNNNMKNHVITKDLVSTNAILSEIKNYALSI